MRYAPILGPIQKNQHSYVLDAVDKKLLLAFSADPRATITSLAKAARVSRDVATYRMQRLEERGVVCGTRLVVAVKELGYESYHIFLKLSNVEENIEKEILEKILALPYIRALIKYFGQYDYEIALIAKSVEEFDNCLTEIIDCTGQYLQSYDVFTISRSFISRALPLSFSAQTQSVIKIAEKGELDELDKKILGSLANDARLSLSTIATKTNVSVDTILYRFKKMNWFVKGATPVINYSALGYTVHAVLVDIAQFDHAQEAKCKEFLQRSEHVIWAVKTIGRANVLAYFCTKEESEFHDAIRAFRNQFPQAIRRFESLSAVSQMKYTLLPACILK